MMSWSDYPLISIIIVPVLILLLLYLTRAYAHAMIARIAMLLHRMTRISARVCLRAEQRLRFRNHEVTKALAEALMQRQLERRFLRIETLVERDLANYQKLSAGIHQQLSTINDDYEASVEVPSVSPEWVEAVDAVASLQNSDRNSSVMNSILADMHKTVQQHQREVMREYRWTVNARHKLLSGLRPQWRKLTKMLEHIDNNIENLRQRLHQTDQHMGQFELLTSGTRQGLMASMLMRFIIALCFVAVGVGAAWVNAQLLEKPLTHILSIAEIGEVSLVNLVVVMHIAITVFAATMVTESLRITHLFPLMAAVTRRGRNTVLTAGGLLLITMAAIEAMALASAPFASEATRVNAVSQWVLISSGVVMPFVLAMVVVPLEYLLCTVRPVIGSVLQLLLHISTLTLRLAGRAVLELGKLVTLLYDVVIFIPLGCEALWHNRQLRASLAQHSNETDSSQPAIDAPNVTALRFGLTKRKDNSSS